MWRTRPNGGRCVGEIAVVLCLLAMARPPTLHAACQVQTVLSITPTDGGSPSTQIHPISAPSSGAALNNEGIAERLTDVLIYDNGTAPNCFAASSFSVVYNVPLTLPISLSNSTLTGSSAYFDVYDSAGATGLGVSASLNGSTLSLVPVRTGTAGDLTAGAVGSALRVKNVRADVSALSAGLNVTATVTANYPGTSTQLLKNVGIVFSTIAPGASLTAGTGAQNAGATLSQHATFTFSETFGSVFRAGGNNVSGVNGDIATTATSLIFDAGTTVPPGVTVTFPSTITTSASAGSSGIVFVLRAGGACSGAAPCYAIYDTQANSAGISSVTVSTAAAARTGATSTPAIGVNIAQVSGAGTVTLHAFFGPGSATGTGNDDANPTAIPRYVSANTAGGATRNIFSGTWFAIAPNQAEATLSSTSLDFASQALGTTSSIQNVIVTNIAALPLFISSISVSGTDFPETNNCGTTVAGMSSCTITVRFSPTAIGLRTATITMADNAAGSPRTIQLSGTGTTTNPAPTLTSISPSSVAAGTLTFTLTAKGKNFVPTSVVQWNGSARNTFYDSATQLRAAILPGDVAVAGTGLVTVMNPQPGGGVSSGIALAIGTSPLPNTPHTYFLPHVVSGSGYVSKVTVVNISASANSVVLNFISQAGVVLESKSYEIAAGGTLRVSTPEADRFTTPVTKWAVVGSQFPVAVNLFFEYMYSATAGGIANTVGFNDAAAMTDLSLPAEFQVQPAGWAAPRTVGVAMANTTGAISVITIALVDSGGTVLATRSFALAPFAQVAMDLGMLAEFQAALPSGNFVGSVTVSATAAVAAIALGDDFGPFAATPVVAGRAR